jgi:hypothetical protein
VSPCLRCRAILLPELGFCDSCLSDLDEWVQERQDMITAIQKMIAIRKKIADLKEERTDP